MTKPEQFATLVSAVAREVMRRRSSEACCGDLTLEQFETLQAVARAAPPASTSVSMSTIGALSAALDVDVSTMSRNVSVLERNGYLARTKSPDDGRVVHVKLTALGRGALSTLRCGERDVLAEVYERLPAGERAGILTALEALRASLERSDREDRNSDGRNSEDRNSDGRNSDGRNRDGRNGDACCAPVPLRRRAS